MTRPLKIGSRGSKLALVQTRWVIDRIRESSPGLDIKIETIKTQGDKVLDVPLAKIGDKGLFVKEIEQALLGGRIDVAVHSMKDMPTEETDGLVIGAVPEREDPSDVLLSREWELTSLPHGARIGSSSLRRRAQILHYRPDLNVQDLHGNLDTRIQRLEDGDFDAIILAAAGLNRLGWHGGREKIPFEICLPAVGQGALAVQCRNGDGDVLDILRKLNHYWTHAAVTAERSLMRALQGGCQVPIGALAFVAEDSLRLNAIVAGLCGKRIIRASRCANMNDTQDLGRCVASELIEAGAGEILSELGAGHGRTSMGAAG